MGVIILQGSCPRVVVPGVVVLEPRDGDRIYDMRCIFVPVGFNALFIVLSRWDNMS